VGCGYNHFKDKFPHAKLTSIDPYIPGADYKMTVTEYQRNFPDRQYDCVLALGSINFGPRAKILEEIEAVDKLTRPEGIQVWRVNPRDEVEVNPKFPISELIQYFQWDEPFIRKTSEIYNYRVIEYKDETASNGSRRIFFVMKKGL
jgi:phosphatidylserine/phosphatidylglycerophosphate/cardiolipin synthase-like enzyme